MLNKRMINILHHTWSNNEVDGVHAHILSYMDPYNSVELQIPQTQILLDLLHNKTIIGIHDPMFELITNGYVGGQLELHNGLPTGRFACVDYFVPPRIDAYNRELRLQEVLVNTIEGSKVFGYIIDINGPSNIGGENAYTGVKYLTDIEKSFYGSFFFTVEEPTSSFIMGILQDSLDNELVEITPHGKIRLHR